MLEYFRMFRAFMDESLNRETHPYLKTMLSSLFCDKITVFYDFDGTGLSVITKSPLPMILYKNTFSNKPKYLLTDLYVVGKVSSKLCFVKQKKHAKG